MHPAAASLRVHVLCTVIAFVSQGGSADGSGLLHWGCCVACCALLVGVQLRPLLQQSAAAPCCAVSVARLALALDSWSDELAVEGCLRRWHVWLCRGMSGQRCWPCGSVLCLGSCSALLAYHSTRTPTTSIALQHCRPRWCLWRFSACCSRTSACHCFCACCLDADSAWLLHPCGMQLPCLQRSCASHVGVLPGACVCGCHCLRGVCVCVALGVQM